MFGDQYVKQRIAKGEELRKVGVNPYPSGAKKQIKNADFLEKFAYLKNIRVDDPDASANITNKKMESDPNTLSSEAHYRVAGRIKFLRLMGKAAFVKIEDESGILQIYLSQTDLGDNFTLFKKFIEVGDIIGARGFPFITKMGELSLHAQQISLITKAICPLPEKFHGLVDIESRYRQRYLDMICNAEVRNTFALRSRIVSSIRRFFENRGFLEVETPMMHPIAGGANAKPFITHHNALGVDRYLRIAPELYLKRLIVGGFSAIFEINRCFRNEGMDATHNPEFTTIEFYWAYKTYEDLMNLTQSLFAVLLNELGLPSVLPYGDLEVNFSDFRRYTYKEALVQIGGLAENTIDSIESLSKILESEKVKIENADRGDLGRLQALAFDYFVESKLINPTFITDFPISISPLARRSDENPQIAERFELFIAGKEIANGFNELNDPLDQYERFKAQVAAKEAGDEEAQFMDEDFITALSYGMPPTAGEGIGIDRLVMLLTNNTIIKDVILFPALRPEKEQREKAQEAEN